MANNENLIPVTKLSKEAAKKIQTAGGKARGKQQTKEKKLRETFETMFKYIGKQRIEENPEFKDIIEDMGALNFEIAQIITNPKGNDKTRLAALRESMDRMHGKPTQVTINREVKPFDSNEDLELIDQFVEKIKKKKK